MKYRVWVKKHREYWGVLAIDFEYLTISGLEYFDVIGNKNEGVECDE